MDLLEAFIGLSFALASIVTASLFANVLWNNYQKKRLLEEYADGQDVVGTVVQSRAIRISDYQGALRTYRIRYSYRSPETDQVVIKPWVAWPSQAEASPRRGDAISLKVLSGHAMSGYPQVLVDQREETFGAQTTRTSSLFLLLLQLGVTFCSFVFFTMPSNDPVYRAGETCDEYCSALMFLWINGILFCVGYFVARFQYDCWEERMLHAQAPHKDGGAYAAIPLGTTDDDSMECLLPKAHVVSIRERDGSVRASNSRSQAVAERPEEEPSVPVATAVLSPQVELPTIATACVVD